MASTRKLGDFRPMLICRHGVAFTVVVRFCDEGQGIG